VAKRIAERSIADLFKLPVVPHARASVSHTLATELLGNGASFEDVADILGNSPEIVRKHYAKWSPARQSRIDDLMARVHSGIVWAIQEGEEYLQ
jgi:predicted transcriptional regulator